MMEREALGLLDEAILHLDSPAEPWSVHLEVRYRNALDERRLGEAVRAALDRHSGARAKLAASPRRRSYEWVASPSPDVDPYDVVHCDSDDALAAAREELLSRPVPLDTSPPLRIRLLRHPETDVVMLNLHHAAGDGMAALVLLQSVARAYASRPEAVGDLPRGPRGPEVTRLSRPQLRAVAGELLEAARPSARIASEGGRDAPGYALHLLALDAARTQALRERGRSDGATVNDLLMAALHLCVASWNAEHGAPARRVSVLMPVNLRPRRRWREGFGNFTFMAPVSTLPPDRSSPAMAVAAVRRRTGEVKNERTAAAAVSCLQRLRYLPLPFRRWLVRQAARESVVPTTLLSNLGVIEHDLDLGPGVGAPTQVWFSPPAKMPLGLAVGALTADEQLQVAFRARHPLLGREALARFAAAYESALDTVIDVGAPFLRPSASRARAA